MKNDRKKSLISLMNDIMLDIIESEKTNINGFDAIEISIKNDIKPILNNNNITPFDLLYITDKTYPTLQVIQENAKILLNNSKAKIYDSKHIGIFVVINNKHIFVNKKNFEKVINLINTGFENLKSNFKNG